MPDRFDVVIVGSGPAGASAAAHAAELKLSHVLLEACPHLSNTIYRYQKGKHVMDEPGALPLRSPLEFRAGSREQILKAWDDGVARHSTNVWYQAEVKAIRKEGEIFTVKLTDGRVVEGKHIVLGIGLQGNLRKMGIPGEDVPFVQYQLDDPDEYQGETIVIVGAGDAAIENALALAPNNQVVLINRRDEFARAKEGNLNLVLKAIEEGTIQCYYGTAPETLIAVEGGRKPGKLVLATPKGRAEVDCDRIIARLGANPPRAFVEACGVVFPSKDPAAVPAVSSTYESNVPGLYIIGALGGYPLIKQAMNQGYEVIEYILGRKVEPADEPLLRDKFKAMPGFTSVDAVLKQIQQTLPLLAGITTLQLREFLLDSEIKVLNPGEVVFKRNDYTTTFFSIIRGGVEIYLDEAGSKRAKLKQGEFFGEMSLISGRRRSATIVASDGCVLIETPRRSMNRLLQSVEAVKQTIDRAFVERALRSRFAETMAKEQVEELVATAKIKRLKAGETLFKEGAEADGLYLVRLGSLTISREFGGKEITLAYVAAGNYVGEMALFGEGNRTATAKAAIATETVLIDKAAFQAVLRRNPLLAQQVQREYRARLAQNMATQSVGANSDIISFLVAQGAGEATDILLIDESLCVRCDNCEKACAETHGGTSRLDREAGPTFANVHVPTSCRHCEHPHCMKDCPPDAIHRAPNGEVYIADNCIGCGNCERNCPYGVIHMAAPTKAKPGLWSWLFLARGSGPGDAPKDPDSKGEKKAVKCDMCKDQAGGAACVRACPTGAAIRIHPEQLPQYAMGRR